MSPSGDKRILVTHQPVGLSILITPWNFPAGMATRKIGPAIAAGCTMILKPAGETPLTALAIVDILDRAGVPKGVVNLILPTPTGPAIAKMLHDKRVKNLSFTGSTEVGRIILKEAADNVIRCSMELGGNAPFVIMDDANVDEAVKGLMLAKMRNGGAACTAANRVYVQRPVAKEFMEKFAAAMGAFVMGRGRDEGIQLGASVSVKERNKIAELVDASKSRGAKVHLGGTTPDGAGAFYPATVLEVAKDDAILAEEVFGPVAPVVLFDTDDEALAMANDTEYGLNSSIWGGRQALAAASQIRSGTVTINEGFSASFASHDAPMGGMKASGIGRRHGRQGLLKYTQPQNIAVQRLVGISPFGSQTNEAFARLITRLLQIWNKIS